LVGRYLPTPGAFFGQLTERRWQLVRELQAALGLVERDESGALACPYVDIHVDMHLAVTA